MKRNFYWHRLMNRFEKVSIYLTCFLLCTVAFAQEKSHQFQTDKPVGQEVPNAALTRVTLKLDKVTLEEALAIISEKGSLKLNYNRNRLPLNKKVSIDVKDEPILQTLLTVLHETGTGLRIMAGGHFAIIPFKTKTYGKISGRVIDADTRQPLVGVNIIVTGTMTGSASDSEGRFLIPKLHPGVYSLMVSMIGYAEQRLNNIVILQDTVLTLNFELKQEAILLNQVIVTPGQFSIMGQGPTVQQALTREDLEIAPLGEDVYRAVTRLPGVSSGDFSAKFAVRGGENDEILLLLDGMELLEPFHLKDIDGGALSIIDVAAVEGIDLMTGSFSAEFGDRKSGVFNIKSLRTPARRKSTSVGISFMNARIMSVGTFADDRGSWLFSARRGYLDMVMKLMEEKDPPQPVYYDILGKVDYKFQGKHTLSANFLHSGDRLNLVEDDNDEDNTGYDNTYGWMTLRYVPGSKLYFQTIASYGRLTHDRQGTGYDGDTGVMNFMVADEKNVDMYGLKQDWNLDISDRWYLKWGWDMKHLQAAYNYHSIRQDITWLSEDTYSATSDTNNTNLHPSGNKFGIYLSNRFRILTQLTAEIGIRYDHISFAGDDLLSPRFNLVYALREQTFLRGGWGYFYQSQGIHELRIPDGDIRFFPAELARQWVAGFEHTFRNGLNLRLEGYYKEHSDLRPDYRNLTNEMEIFPEVQSDRFKLNFTGATSKGIETYLKYDRGGKLTWWASYALANTNEDISSLIYDDVEYITAEEFPGKFDQRHSFYLDVNYRPNRNWRLNIAWQFHSGWPYTETELVTTKSPDGSVWGYKRYGEYNGKNYPPYHRLDFTINRHFHTAHGRFSAFFAVINVYNHGNVRNIKYIQDWDSVNERPYLVEENNYWFKLLPSIGVSWSWDH
jgi:hypothetical protein